MRRKKRTRGLSPKALVAGLVPALGTLVAVGVEWVATGALDRLELATAASGAGTALLTFLAAWAAGPGDVVDA
jgi:hypothetical protein